MKNPHWERSLSVLESSEFESLRTEVTFSWFSNLSQTSNFGKIESFICDKFQHICLYPPAIFAASCTYGPIIETQPQYNRKNRSAPLLPPIKMIKISGARLLHMYSRPDPLTTKNKYVTRAQDKPHCAPPGQQKVTISIHPVINPINPSCAFGKHALISEPSKN